MRRSRWRRKSSTALSPVEHPVARVRRRQPEARAAAAPSRSPDACSWSPASLTRASGNGEALNPAGRVLRSIGALLRLRAARRQPVSATPPASSSPSIRIFNGDDGARRARVPARRIGTPEGAPLYPWRMFGIRTVFIGAELLSRDRGAARQGGARSHSRSTRATRSRLRSGACAGRRRSAPRSC